VGKTLQGTRDAEDADEQLTIDELIDPREARGLKPKDKTTRPSTEATSTQIHPEEKEDLH
jgi:hypothetical protein